MAFRQQSSNSSASESTPKWYGMGEAVNAVGIPAHTLRYWQSEFSCIKPHISSSGHRRYRHKDIELFRRIKELVIVEGYTIAGARQILEQQLREEKIISDGLPAAPADVPKAQREAILTARALTLEILDLLK